MKNILTNLVLVAVAAGTGAVVALKPWSSETEPPAPEIIEQAPVVPEVVTAPEPANTPEPVAAPEPTDSDSKKLSMAVDILKSLNSRMGSLEEKVAGLEEDIDINRLNAEQDADYEPEPPRNLTEEEQAAQALVRKQARDKYFSDLEQSIAGEFNEPLSQEISNSFDSFLSSGEAWTEGVSVNANECGGGFCKVVVNYPADMDPNAQFELDGRVYLEVSKQLPQSKSIERTNSDGTKEIVIYFAEEDAKFPRFPE